MHETVTKRVLWVAKCDCKQDEPFQKEWSDNPPREVKCPHCDEWITPKEETYIGKDKFNQ